MHVETFCSLSSSSETESQGDRLVTHENKVDTLCNSTTQPDITLPLLAMSGNVDKLSTSHVTSCVPSANLTHAYRFFLRARRAVHDKKNS